MIGDIKDTMFYSLNRTKYYGDSLIKKMILIRKEGNLKMTSSPGQSVCFPESIEEKSRYLIVNDKYHIKNLYLEDFPAKVTSQWLDDLLSIPNKGIISLTFVPLNKYEMLKVIKKQIIDQKDYLLRSEFRGKFVNPINVEFINELEKLYISLEKGLENLYSVSLVISLLGSFKSINESEKYIVSLGESMGAQIKNSSYRQFSSFLSVLPRVSLFEENKVVDTTTLSYSSLFSSSSIIEENGIFYGINKYNNEAVIVNRFNRENYNSITLAKSGMGKTFQAKIEIMNLLRKGVKVVVIDLEGEYVKLCKKYNGKVVNLGFKFKSSLNPFFINKAVLSNQLIEEKIQFLKEFFKMSCDYYDGNILDEALVNIFQRKYPSMDKLDKELMRMGERAEFMRRAIYNLVSGSNKHLYNNHLSVKYNNIEDDFLVFNISSLDEKNKKLMFFVITEFIWNSIRRDNSQRVLVIDEAHKLLDDIDIARYFKGLTKRSRKYNLGIFFISQDIGDFLKSNDGQSIISNCATKLLLGQSKLNINLLKKTFELNQFEEDLLYDMDIGEALLMAGKSHSVIRIEAVSSEKELIML